MEDGEDSDEAPEAFLNSLGKSLADQAGLDQDLVGILKKHLLQATPAEDAVTLARDAILRLAAERAAPPAAEPPDE